ncbi:MAG: hypothetical protein IPH61_09075 [Bacteroidetes bacterium]|nr:hypothetical protein [Bacteroidota bacterium]
MLSNVLKQVMHFLNYRRDTSLLITTDSALVFEGLRSGVAVLENSTTSLHWYFANVVSCRRTIIISGIRLPQQYGI